MLPKILPTDIEGLNIVLGGGIPVVSRGGAAPSTVILIRGAPGVGKTAFGTQIAASLARLLAADVAYGCVELLPEELAAQHAGFMRSQPGEVVPFPISGPVPQDTCRIFAAILPLGDPAAESLRPTLEKLRADVASHGGNPRVLVVDSLSVGYGLGPATPRPLVDEVCKFAAAEGLILLLLEEAIDDRASTWSFAADVVISLGLNHGAPTPGLPESSERRLLVTKNRFGPSDPGPHAFTLATHDGVVVMPRPTAYLRPYSLVRDWLDPKRPKAEYAPWPAPDRDGWPLVNGSAILVHGGSTYAVYRAAFRIGGPIPPATGSDVFVAFGQGNLPDEFRGVAFIHCADPYLNPSTFLTDVLSAIRRMEGPVQRVFFGDLTALRLHVDERGFMRAMVVIIAILKASEIPCILVESGSVKAVSELANFVDVLVEVSDGHPIATVRLAGGAPGGGYELSLG